MQKKCQGEKINFPGLLLDPIQPTVWTTTRSQSTKIVKYRLHDNEIFPKVENEYTM